MSKLEVKKPVHLIKRIDKNLAFVTSNKIVILKAASEFLTLLECKSTIRAIEFNPKTNNLAVTSNDKKLLIFHKKSNFTLQSETNLFKKATCLKFTPKNDLLVSDKFGDCYKFKLDQMDKPLLFVGHVSILTDLLFFDKYLVSSDRDEKIRINYYPNSYDIKAFCLGHTEFVSRIEKIDSKRFISGGGDSFLICWNLDGKAVQKIDILDHVAVEAVSEVEEPGLVLSAVVEVEEQPGLISSVLSAVSSGISAVVSAVTSEKKPTEQQQQKAAVEKKLSKQQQQQKAAKEFKEKTAIEKKTHQFALLKMESTLKHLAMIFTRNKTLLIYTIGKDLGHFKTIILDAFALDLCFDLDGNLYVATLNGVKVFSKQSGYVEGDSGALNAVLDGVYGDLLDTKDSSLNVVLDEDLGEKNMHAEGDSSLNVVLDGGLGETNDLDFYFEIDQYRKWSQWTPTGSTQKESSTIKKGDQGGESKKRKRGGVKQKEKLATKLKESVNLIGDAVFM
jgi:hypothetical protein